MKKPLFSVLVEGIIELHNKGGHEALGAIISKSISISQLSDFGLKKLKREKIEELEEKLERLKKEENARS